MSFVHLHLHTQYSLLDGMNQIAPLIETAKQFKMPAVAMTDHGNLFGAIEFYQAARKAGIKPIIGCEAYMAPKTRFDKEGSSVYEDDYKEGDGRANPYYHLILLAANEVGYKNLMKLISIAHTEGFYYKPRIDKEVLQKYSAGLIGLSGCLRGEVPYLLNLGLTACAQTAAGTYREIFQDRFYIEIQDNGLELQRTVNKKLIALARRNNLPIVATNDCHYLHKTDTAAHDIMLCLQTGKTVNTPHRMRFDTDQLYFKSPEEMAAAFSELPEAVKNTLEIADQVDLTIPLGVQHLPNYETPEGTTRDDYLKQLAEAGLLRRLETLGKADPSPSAYHERLVSELKVIQSVGYAGYFLIVWDIIHYAKSQGIPVGPGRGSAAGSLVAYALGITDIDPMAYGLIFERFLNPERISPPDIDVDISMDHRGDVLSYVSQKFGSDHVCQIITFGTMSAKAVVRDVGRVLEIPYGEVDKIAKLIPDTLNITLDEALAQEPKLLQALEEDPKRVELMKHAKRLEGLVRHASTHAAGVVISAEPLTEHLPIYRGTHGEMVTQYAMEEVEKIGLIKFDFLGLRTLTVIDCACRMIRKPDLLAKMPMNDPETYAFLGSGATTGIFQLESSGMRDLLVKMKPSQFEDLIALLALYRPGPLNSGMVEDYVKRKQGKAVHYELPELEPILKETYGVILYQEQVMKIAHLLAGFSLGEADLLRRAMGKKKPEEMAAQKNRFVEGATKRGVALKKAEKIFDLIEYFSGYGFNKSHSAAYALITYQTAYLKCHFKQEFMAALLTSERGNSDKVVRYITECRRMGIVILPPDVNESEKDFTVVDRGIRFGLAAIKNVGDSAVDAIIHARSGNGPFKSFLHFCQTADLRKVNKRVVEGLVKSGAFDFTGIPRTALLPEIESAMHAGEKAKKSVKQLSLFPPPYAGSEQTAPVGHCSYAEGEQTAPVGRCGTTDVIASTATSGSRPPTGGSGTTGHVVAGNIAGIFDTTATNGSRGLGVPVGTTDATIATMEKETLGFYITSHPLARYEAAIKQQGAVPIEAIEGKGHPIRICGMVSEKRAVRTKKGDTMAYLQLEDMTGSVEVIVFPDLYRTAVSLLALEQPIVIQGTVESGEQGTKVKATALRLLKMEVATATPPTGGVATATPEPRLPLVAVEAPTPAVLPNTTVATATPEPRLPLVAVEAPTPVVLPNTTCSVVSLPPVGGSLIIRITSEATQPATIQEIKKILQGHIDPDKAAVYIKVATGSTALVCIDTKLKVDPSEQLIKEVEALLGAGSVIMESV